MCGLLSELKQSLYAGDLRRVLSLMSVSGSQARLHWRLQCLLHVMSSCTYKRHTRVSYNSESELSAMWSKTFNAVRHVSWNVSSSDAAVSRCRLLWYQVIPIDTRVFILHTIKIMLFISERECRRLSVCRLSSVCRL